MWGNVRIVTPELSESEGLHPFTTPNWPTVHESPYCTNCGVHKDGHTGRPMGLTEAQQAANRRHQ